MFIVLMFSCNEDNPYHEYEAELIDQVCDCISLGKKANQNNFLEKYEDCTKKTSELLKNGLDQYPEDTRMSKEAYQEKIPELIQDLVKNNKCW